MSSTIRKCSGCVVIKSGKVLLVRSTGSGNWTFPKGGVENGMTSKANAVKETYEEAGIIGNITRKLGTYQCEKQGVVQQVVMYRLKMVLELTKYPESRTRKRKWFPIPEAMKLLDPVSAELIRRAH